MNNELAVVEPKQDAYALIMRAVSDPSCDPEKLGKLLAVRNEWEAAESKKAFAAALAGFASECPIVAKLDPDDKGKYAKINHIAREIRPLKRKYGIFVSWTESRLSDNGQMVHMRGMLCHSAGHSVAIAFDMPFPEPIVTREGKRVGNDCQSMGSAMSYCQRYGECAILGVVTGNDNDGASPKGPATRARLSEVRFMMQKVGRTEDAACKFLNVQSLDTATADQIEQLFGALRVRQSAPAQHDAGKHVPTRAESLAIIAGAKEPKKSAALDQRDLTPANYANGNDEDLAYVAGLLRNE